MDAFVVPVVKTDGDMVVAFSSDAFARDELLAEHLVGCAILGSTAPVSVVSVREVECRFVSDSGTGVRQA